MSKESAIKFLRELKTNEKAKDLLQGMEKPKNKDEAIKAYAEVAKELGEDISPEDFAQALKEIEAEIHQKTEAVSADMVELEDNDLENVAGGHIFNCDEILLCGLDYAACDEYSLN